VNSIHLPMDLGAWFLHDQVKKSPYAVKATNKWSANYFIVNTNPSLSFAVGRCNGMTHTDRQKRWYKIIKKSNLFLKRPQDHMFICQHWDCHNIIYEELWDLIPKMTYLIHEANLFWISQNNKFRKPENLIVIPYVGHSAIKSLKPKRWDERMLNITFLGTNVTMSRKTKLRKVLDKPEVRKIVNAGIGNKTYQEAMSDSKFCLIIEGDTPSSRRLFDAMLAGCIPVFIGQKTTLPFENIIPYRLISIRINHHVWQQDTYNATKNVIEMNATKAIEIHKNLLQYIKYVDWRNSDFVLQGILSNMDLISKNLNVRPMWNSRHGHRRVNRIRIDDSIYYDT